MMNPQSGDGIYSIQDPGTGSRNGLYGARATTNQDHKRTRASTLEIVDSVTLDKGSENPLECFGYCRSTWRCIFFWLFVIFTAGLLLFVMYWKPAWKLKLTKRRCPLRQADTVLLGDQFGHLFVESVQKITLPDGIVGEHVITESGAASSEDTSMLAAKEMNYVKYFDHRHVRYIWDKNNQFFTKLEGLDGNLTIAVLHDEYSKGLGEAEQRYRFHLYGENSIIVQVKSYFRLFIEEVLNPFYVFQICSIILWSLDDYYIYASCIFVISAISLGVELYETRKQSETLRDMVSSAETTLTVLRGSGEEEVHTTQLVPGDVVIVPPNGCVMMCDAVLLSGNAIVNESMLTGESVPVTKTPVAQSEANEIYSSEVHKRHTLFCGTHVIQTRYYGDAKVKAVVVGTGFSTAKGELVRSILYPKPMGFKFYKDAMKFILLLACIAAVGMTYSIAILVKQGAAVEKVILRALDIITIVVPPALPAAMTVGTVYAQNRLKKAGIFCISPPRINVCGKLKCICFDKTGTLTEDGLDFWGIVPTYQEKFQLATQNPAELNTRGNLMAAMATCHSLTMIGGELNGDPLDLIMFNATNWEIEEPGKDTSKFDSLVPTVVRPKLLGATNGLAHVEPPTDPVWVVPSAEEHMVQGPSRKGLTKLQLEKEILGEPGSDTSKFDSLCPTVVKPITRETYSGDVQQPQYEIGIIRQFTFSSSLQRMSVITRVLGADHMDLYCKGAPEKVATLCKKETLPDDFHEVLQRYTMHGFRVIGLAWRPLESRLTWPQAQRIAREKVETGLSFLGLLILENTLKPQTTPVIHQLREADIRTVMVTGDNMLTAISVARQCGMVPGREAIILVNVHQPENDKPASIQWEYADVDSRENEVSDTESTDEGPTPDTEGLPQIVIREEPESDERTLYQSSVTIDRDFTLKYHFAVTGRSFSLLKQYFPHLVSKICVRGTVFARMSPDQKSQLVEQLQGLGYCVGMCGDGANDCGALKTAHAGISLSEAEASVASPFTSKSANIECVPTVIREGRAALTTSFGVFKYMALYSIVQFVSVCILYSKETNLGDWMFLYIDLVITTTVAVLMGHTGAYHRLVRKRPAGSLVAPSNVFSVGMHILIVVGFQAGAYLLLLYQPWFTPLEPSIKLDNVVSWETTIVFYVSAFQYLMLAFIFSKGPPYRKRIWTNGLFLLALVILTGITMWLVIYPPGFLIDLLQLKVIPDGAFWFRFILLGVVGANFLAAFILESFIVRSTALKRCGNAIRKKRMPKNKYKLIEKELAAEPCWPPVGEVTLQNGLPPSCEETTVVTLDQAVADLRESDT